jgi:hypothetical protein
VTEKLLDITDYIHRHEEYWLPEPWLKKDNEIIIFEEEEKLPNNVRLVAISR